MRKLQSISLLLSGLFLFKAFGTQIIPDNTFRDDYLYHCQKKEGINICYPEREENTSEVIDQAISLGLDQDYSSFCQLGVVYETQKDVDVCIARARGVSEFKVCEIQYEGESEMIEICQRITIKEKAFADDFDQKLIECEHDYLYALRSHFKDEFPGLNISFTSESKEIDFLYNAVIDADTDPFNIVMKSDYSRDILLLPEHGNNAYCNEDSKISLEMIDKHIAQAKSLMRQRESYEGIKAVNKILDKPNEELAIISITCSGKDAKAEKIGEHQVIKPKRPVTPKKVEEKKVEEGYKCVDKDIESLLAYDKEMSKSSPIGPVMGGYELGYGPKVYPYTSTNMLLDEVVKLNCMKAKGKVLHKLDGLYIQGKKVDISHLSTNYFYGDIESSSLAKENLEFFVEDLNDSDLNNSTIQEAIKAQQQFEFIKKSVEKDGMTAGDGYYWGFCLKRGEYIQVKEGMVLDFDCYTESAEAAQARLEAAINGLGPATEYPGMEMNEETMNDYPIENWETNLDDDDFSDDFEDSGYEDTGSW